MGGWQMTTLHFVLCPSVEDMAKWDIRPLWRLAVDAIVRAAVL